MKFSPFLVLRIALAITFVWIGILIVQDPATWAGYIQSWALSLMPLPVEQIMLVTGILDIVLGILLLFNLLTWWVSLIASIHIIIVLITTGINSITIRDIGLLGGTLAIMLSVPMPSKIRQIIKK